MGITTQDRISAALANAEHRATYGTDIPTPERIVAKMIVTGLAFIGLVVLLAFMVAGLLDAADVERCQAVMAGFTGPTDHPAAVECAAILAD